MLLQQGIQRIIKPFVLLVALEAAQAYSYCQSIGDAVMIKDLTGNTYTGVIKNIQGQWFQIKYDQYSELRWFTADQFSVVQSADIDANLVGKKVQFLGTDGKTYTGIVKQVNGKKFLIKYTGYDFESWLGRRQFTVDAHYNPASSATTSQQTHETVVNNNEPNTVGSIKNIYNFGVSKGWASPIIASKYLQFVQRHADKELTDLLNYLQTAKTAAAKFFALKSLIMGDTYETVTNFINQLNQYDEGYQQENCLVTNERSIIQQWEYSCSVTLLQTYLADLSPRYAWEVKQIGNYDVISNDPTNPLAIQQKELLEKYGGIASARGDASGKSIGIIYPINELVGPLIDGSFYAQEVNEPLKDIFGKIRLQLDKGINTPLLIGFMGSAGKHFILAMRYKKTGNGYAYLIYDPWDGKCDYVLESAIEMGSLYPLNTSWKISVDYYYPFIHN